jgi:hypothetical protein
MPQRAALLTCRVVNVERTAMAADTSVVRMQRCRNPELCSWECQEVEPMQKTLWQLLKKLKIELPHDPKLLLLEVCNPKN